MSFLSSSKSSYEKVAKSFKEKIDSLNKLNATAIDGTTSQDELTTIANEIKANYNTVCESYDSLKPLHASVADTFVQLINQTIYSANLNKALDEYSSLAKIVDGLSGSDGKLSKLLAKLLELAQLYVAAIDVSVKTSIWIEIQDILAQLGEAVGELAVSAGLLNSEDLGNISTTADENGHHEITSKKAKSLTSTTSTKHVGFIGNVNRSGYVGQKAQTLVLFPDNASDTKPNTTTVSIPLMNLTNTQFTKVGNDEGEVFRLFGIKFFNKYDFYSTQLVENDGSDEDNTEAYVTGKSLVRFGNIVSTIGDFDTNTESTSFRIMVAGSDSWTNGTLKRKGTLSFSNLSIKGKYNGETTYSASNSDKYNTLFADGIDVSFKVTHNNTKYTFAGNNLKYDETYADDHEIVADSGIIDFYYTGSCKLTQDDATTDQTSTSSYYTSKDIVVKLSQQAGTNNYTATFLLDPDSDYNSSAVDDSSLSDPTTYLPFFAGSATFTDLTYSTNVTDSSAVMSAITALLDISKMTEENFNDFYATLLDKLNSAKKNLTDSLLDCISEMEDIATTATMASTIYSSFDSTYCGTYLTNYSSYVATLSSDLSQYTSTASDYDVEDLYNGTFEKKISSDLNDVGNELTNVMSDINDSEKMLYDYETKFAHCGSNGKNVYDISGALASFYNVLTGDSATLTSVATGGTNIFTININLPYSTWMNYYKLCSYGKSDSFEYFFSKPSLQYLYVLTQTYSELSNLSDYVAHFDLIQSFYRYIIIREITENYHNSKLSGIIKQDILTLIEEYESAKDKIDCSLTDYNGYFLNPYITELFPQAETVNTYDIEALLTDNSAENKVNFNNVVETFKPIIYVCLLNSATETVKSKIERMFKFMNGYKVNIREALFGMAFYDVVKSIYNKNDSELSKYSIAISEPEWLNSCEIIFNYNQIINSDDGKNPIRTFFNVDLNKDDFYKAILQQLCSEIIGASDYFNYVTVCGEIRDKITHAGAFKIKYNANISKSDGMTLTPTFEFGPVYYMNLGTLLLNGDTNDNYIIRDTPETITVDGAVINTSI